MHLASYAIIKLWPLQWIIRNNFHTTLSTFQHLAKICVTIDTKWRGPYFRQQIDYLCRSFLCICDHGIHWFIDVLFNYSLVFMIVVITWCININYELQMKKFFFYKPRKENLIYFFYKSAAQNDKNIRYNIIHGMPPTCWN